MITVRTHNFHGGHILYQGNSFEQAVKIARKDPCSKWDSDCGCGGAIIIKTDDNGDEKTLHCWRAVKRGTKKAFDEPFWM
ncbi:MAG: hypothetical protein EOM59_14555 [Clostridia bacterium]|nr:hypothetical protein [Clostridia bacterium]